MVRCDNCFGIAAYTCADPGVNPVSYCENCLPVWLHDRAEAGHFPLVQLVTEEPSEPVETTTKKKKATSSNADSN